MKSFSLARYLEPQFQTPTPFDLHLNQDAKTPAIEGAVMLES